MNGWSSWQVRAELERLLVRDLLGPWGEADEELPAGSSPSERYVVGVLSPKGATLSLDDLDDPVGDGTPGEATPEVAAAAAAGSMAPGSLGLSFSLPRSVERLVVSASWGRYERGESSLQVTEDGKPRTVWRRYPCGGQVEVDVTQPSFREAPDPSAPQVLVRAQSREYGSCRVVDVTLVNEKPEPPTSKDVAKLYQCRVSVTALDGGSAVFLPHNDPSHAPAGDSVDLAAPEADDAEMAGLRLLYRGAQQFAVGRNAAVEVDRRPEESRAWRVSTSNLPAFEVPQTIAPKVREVDHLAGLQVDMRWLAEKPRDAVVGALRPLADGYRAWLAEQELRLVNEPDLAEHRDAALANLEQGRLAADRIGAGIDLLERDDRAWAAWRFANEAMAMQRQHTEVIAERTQNPHLSLAETEHLADTPDKRSWRPFQLAFVLLNLPSLTDPTHPDRGLAERGEGLVDLLFFPTGGGKTEAYLGLTAYTFAIRRLRGLTGDGPGRDGGTGVAVLMRYTLRLLTAQQFQRAATLVCAAELIRRRAVQAGRNPWGAEPFRIGLWVGSKVTPNWYHDAEEALDQSRSAYARSAAGNPVQVLACPWCGRAIQPGQDADAVADVRRVLVWCGDPDGRCPFTRKQSHEPWGEGLPVLTVDEEVFRLAPALVIGTVDKFAQLPLRGWTGMLFGGMTSRCDRHGFTHPDLAARIGCGPGGHQKTSRWPSMKPRTVPAAQPPDLIIQDELHLISGALGTLVGLYETAVDRLASYQVGGKRVRPKVVASTATVRRAAEQVWGLFDRRLAVFPPPILDAGQTFFSTQVEVSQNTPGRRYLGVCAHGQRMKYVQIRVTQLLLAASQLLFDEHGADPGNPADPYMTLVAYFNATHELAAMRRMVEDDITTRLRSQERRGLANRGEPAPEELTARVNSEAIGRTLQQLGYTFDPDISSSAARQGRTALSKARREAIAAKNKAEVKRIDAEIAALPQYPVGKRPIDVLLATSMLQVGVDVPRLGLMMVVGQPKNAAEYIQATSRVGRSDRRPGLVVTIGNWARPRDLAHFETFAHYHETFYARVEALSVTPFADRALDRGLTGVLVAAVRHAKAEWEVEDGAHAVPITSPEIDEVIDWIADRGAHVLVDADMEAQLRAQCTQRMDQWDRRRNGLESGRLSYSERPANGSLQPLLDTRTSNWGWWSVGTSLREVEPEANLLMHLDAPEVAGRPDWDFSPVPSDTPPGDADHPDHGDDGDDDGQDGINAAGWAGMDELGPQPEPGLRAAVTVPMAPSEGEVSR